MVDFTSGGYHFRQAVARGDFYAALGLDETASKLDIDVAAARQADRSPEIASQVTAVANVLNNHDRKAVYRVLRDSCDRIYTRLGDRCGTEVFEAIPDCRCAIWRLCCELLRFDLDQTELLVGPKGASSLAERCDDWIIESLAESRLMVLNCTSEELLTGSATRELWHAECPACGRTRDVLCRMVDRPNDGSALPADELEAARYDYEPLPCPSCRAESADPSEYEDTYTFDFSAGSLGGRVVRGQGMAMCLSVYAILSGLPTSACPPHLLEQFYSLQQDGEDVSIESVEARPRTVFPQLAVQPRRQPAPGGSGVGAGAACIVTFLMLMVLRGACHYAQHHASNQVPRNLRPYEHDWNPPFWQPPRVNRDEIQGARPPASTRYLLRQIHESIGRRREQLGWDVLDDESQRAAEEAKGHEEKGEELNRIRRRREAAAEFDAAREIWQELADQHPEKLSLQRRLAGVYYSLGRAYSQMRHCGESQHAYGIAISIYERLMDSESRTEGDVHCLGGAHCNLAHELREEGKCMEAMLHYDSAIAVLQVHLTETPECETATRFLGNAFWGRGTSLCGMNKWEEAIEDFGQAIELRPKVADIYRDRGAAYGETENWEEAVSDFTESARLEPSSWRTWYYLALVKLRRRDVEGYRATCQEMLVRFGDSQDASAANTTAWSVALSPNAVDDYGPFIQLAERAVAARPSHASFRNTLGAVLCRDGRPAEAVPELQKAIELRGKSGNPCDWFLLSIACHKLEEPDQAGCWREHAALWIDEGLAQADGGGRVRLSWNRKVEIELLRQEAEALGDKALTPPCHRNPRQNDPQLLHR